jgi:hypothetical protein
LTSCLSTLMRMEMKQEQLTGYINISLYDCLLLDFWYLEISCLCNRPWRPKGREWSRLPHLLDNRLTDGGKVVSPMRRPPLPPRKIHWN